MEMKAKEIPVLLLTGYLGSGKTTLVNRILANERGVRFAVIVNDIGEVNIDADLIQKGGLVGKKDDSLVALQNGCICCTLRTDLIEQIQELTRMGRFDYIVIEASGICEPEPIAQTICSIPRLGAAYTKYGICRLDCIVTVVDALRLRDEFACGDDLEREGIGEEDIENLITQQIEFCNIILLNKASEVKLDELARVRRILRVLQPGARILECDYANVDIDKLIHTGLFDFERVATSAGWIRGIERPLSELEEHDHDHEHEEHGHDHDHGQARWRNTASARSCIIAGRRSTSISSTASSLPSGRVTSSGRKVFAISATTRICRSSSSRRGGRSNCRKPACGMPRPRRRT